MRKKQMPMALLTGEYVTLPYSHTLLTIKDNSLKKQEEASTENYSMIFSGYLPLGVTNEIIKFEGMNAVQRFVEHCGQPNTLLYGPAGTCALEALKSGFTVYFCNTRLLDATYPNMYISMDCAKHKTEEITVYAWLESDTSYYHMALDKDELPEEATSDSNGANIKEIKVPLWDFGFKAHYIEDCKNDDLGSKKKTRGFNVEQFMKKDAIEDTITGSTKPGIEDDEVFHLPLYGLFYRGAGTHGNVYRFKATLNPNKIANKYPEFTGEILSQGGESMHKFMFATFDVNKYNVNMGFGDQASEACKIKFTKSNHTDTFRAYSISRKNTNVIGKLLAKMESKTKASFLAKVKETYVSFDEGSSDSDFDLIMEELMEWKNNLFTPPVLGTSETWLSLLNIFKPKEFEHPMSIKYSAAPSEITFAGGKDGVLGEVLKEGEFDWNQTVMYEGQSIKVWEKMLLDFWTVKTDRSLLDPRMVRDCIVYAEGVSQDVQQAIDDLVYYKEDVFNYDKSRPDFFYWKTPNDTISSLEEVTVWVRSFLNSKNASVTPNVGSFRFTDPYTGAQIRMNGMFSWLGTNGSLYKYLISGVSDPFASGSWSLIQKAATNSEELIPSNGEELTQLTQSDITYYQMQSNGTFKLGLDTTYIPSFDSVGKNIGYTINNGRIMNISYLILSDNKIIKPTATNLEALQDAIKASIAPFTKIFDDRVTVKVSLSDHPEEINKSIVKAEVVVYGDNFSTRNRCEFVINNSADAN